MTLRTLKSKKILLQVGSFFASVLPLGAVVLSRGNTYAPTMGEAIKLSAGGVIALILLLLKVLGKLKMPRRVTVFAMVFVMSYLLAPVLSDLMLLSGAALGGELLDEIVFCRLIAKVEKKIALEENASATAGKVEEVLQNYMGGRV